MALAIATLLLYQAADSQWSYPPRSPDLLYLLWYTAITLPIHEGGHLLFSPFGRIMTIAGGSFWQIAIPLIMTAVAMRERSFWAWIYCIITGVHMIALNAYIYDAPYRTLPLLGGDRSRHDWHNLLLHWQALGMSEDLALAMYYGGVVVGAAGLAGGFWWTVHRFRNFE